MDLCLIFQLKSYLCSTNRKGMNVIYDLSEMLTSFTMTELVKASNCFPCKGIIPDSSRGNTKCLCGVSVDTKHGLLVFGGFCVTRRPCRRNVLPSEWLESLVFENLRLPRGMEARFLAENSLLRGMESIAFGNFAFRAAWEVCFYAKRLFRFAWKAIFSGGMAFVSLGGRDFSEIGVSCHSEGGNFGRQKFYVTQKADFSIGRASVSLGSGAACGG